MTTVAASFNDLVMNKDNGASVSGESCKSNDLETTEFGDYQLIKPLATGGMAELYLAKKSGVSGFERLLVIKKILPHLAAYQEFVDMFMDESRIAAQLSHPNIVSIEDVGQVEGCYYLAMEYIHGEDLRRVFNQESVRRAHMPFELAAYVIKQVAEALHYAHQKHDYSGQPLALVHRDVSLQNILISYDGVVKMADFGVAKAANKLGRTRTGVLKGKYSYMSPEQAQGAHVDARSDVFSLGIVLYELTTGVRLFKRDSEVDTINAVLAGQVVKPSSLNPRYPAWLESVVMQALAFKPGQRFSSAAELSQALSVYLRHARVSISERDVAAYMRTLFVDKIADRVLVESDLWNEEHTDDFLVEQLKKRKQQGCLPAHKEADSQSIDALSYLNQAARSGGALLDASSQTQRHSRVGVEHTSAGAVCDESMRLGEHRFWQETVVMPLYICHSLSGSLSARCWRYVNRFVRQHQAISWSALCVLVLSFGAGLSYSFFAEDTVPALWVESDPPGALVFFEDMPIPEGKTPLLIRRPIKIGAHALRFELEGYVPQTKTLQVIEPQKKNAVVVKQVLTPTQALAEFLKGHTR